LRLVERGARQQRRQPLDAGDVPCRLVPVSAQGGERVGIGKRGEIALVEPCAMREVRGARECALAPRLLR
jgi:hypothetical protein